MPATLVRPLEVTDSNREGYTLPAGLDVTIRGTLVVLDGRVYRADADELKEAV